MRHHHREPTGHTDWCARDHRCGVAEHRSPDMVVDLPGHGRAVVTRVQAADGREHAEVRARLLLHTTDTGARWQLRTLLTGLDPAHRRDPARHRPRRRHPTAIGHKTTR
jgi:hypothetical protein